MIKDLLKSAGGKLGEFLQFQVYGVSLENSIFCYCWMFFPSTLV